MLFDDWVWIGVMRLLDVKVGDLRLFKMDDLGLGLGCGWFEIIISLGVE